MEKGSFALRETEQFVVVVDVANFVAEDSAHGGGEGEEEEGREGWWEHRSGLCASIVIGVLVGSVWREAPAGALRRDCSGLARGVAHSRVMGFICALREGVAIDVSRFVELSSRTIRGGGTALKVRAPAWG